MTSTTTTPEPAARCPFGHDGHDGHDGHRSLQPDDELALPQHRRAVVQRATRPDGTRELTLYLGDKDVSFDEPDLFAFGEALARQGRFLAGEATRWAPTRPWAELRGLLQTLLDEGVLVHASELPAAAPAADPDRPAPLPPGPNPHPRQWREGAALMHELTGRALEPGWLELVVPVFRVAHMALDADGRQVGESNVFPPALRMDIATRWRTCIYPGTRHQSDRPMNVTALKAMRAHWPQMMAALRVVRAAYLRRFPQLQGAWTVGHLERLATAVLAVPTYALMKASQPVPNGALHPALAGLFRVTDGLRMVMHQMLFVPISEPTLAPDAPMDAVGILAYAERNQSFHSEHGVCAGPQAMVAEFLGVLVHGARPAGSDDVAPVPAVAAALADVEPALDYALMGLQAYAAVFSLWPRMTRAYETLLPRVAAWADAAAVAGRARPALAAWHERLAGHVKAVQQATYLAQESWRADRERVYADMHDQCSRGLGRDDAPLARRLAPAPAARMLPLRAALDTALRERLADGAHGTPAEAAARGAVAAHLAAYLAGEQVLLGVAVEVQSRINGLLGRPAPTRPFDAADIDLHNRLQGTATRRLPDLVAELSEGLGLPIHLDADAWRIGTHVAAVPA